MDAIKNDIYLSTIFNACEEKVLTYEELLQKVNLYTKKENFFCIKILNFYYIANITLHNYNVNIIILNHLYNLSLFISFFFISVRYL